MKKQEAIKMLGGRQLNSEIVPLSQEDLAEMRRDPKYEVHDDGEVFIRLGLEGKNENPDRS
jgi:hypothetical protein